MSEIKLKVGQKVKLRNGEEGVVTAELDGERDCFFMIKYLDDLETCSYTPEGYFHENCDESEYDIVEILEEPKENEKMEENLKEKYEKLIGQTFTTKDDDGDDEITISYVTDSHVYFNSRKYEEEFNATLEEFSKNVIHKSESQEEETVRLPWEDDTEPAGKYELRMTVVDAKKSSTTDKCYYDSLADIGSHVFGVTRGIIDLDKPGTDRSTLLFLLREKGDVVKITRQINISSVNVAVVVIRVTQLKD